MIKAILSILATLAAFFFSKKQVSKREQRKTEKEIKDIHESVHTADEKKLNAHLRGILKGIIVVSLLGTLGGGCASSVLYVPQDEQVVWH
jgi:hypothetical protein